MDHFTENPDDDHLDLPFEPRRRDWAEWVYDHRTGLLVTVGVYLLLGVGIAVARFSLKPAEPVSAFYVEMEDLQELIEEKERLEQQVREEQLLRQMDREYEQIRNRASNAEGELDADLRQMEADVQTRLNASREAYERGLQSASDILNDRPADADDPSADSRTGRRSGRVTVTYYFPSGRSHRSLPVPSYQCEGGGTVVVRVEANASGRITKATASRGADPCLTDYAEQAALRSQFHAGAQEPGTITYEFVAQ